MNEVMNTINTSITQEALWGAVANVMPFIVTTVLFSLGFYLIRKALRKTSHGKAGV